MASTDDQILMDKMVSERNYVLPERSKREAQITGDLETSMVDAAYSVGEPDMRSIVMSDKIRLQDDESGFFDQFYGSLENTIFQDNPRLSGRAIEGMGRVTGIDAMREFGENIVADYEASPDKGSFVPRVSTYEDVDGLNAALDYMGSTIGQGAGSIAMTVGGAVAGAGLGAAGGAAVGAVGGGVGAIPAGAAGAIVGGATGGAVAASFLLNYGDTYEYLMEQEGVDPDKAAELALVPGTIMAGLDAWGVGKLLGPAKRELSANIIKRTGQLAVRGAGIEGVTEAAQQVIQESTGEIAEVLGYATEDIQFSQRVKSSLNALIAGTLTGGAMSGATSPFREGTEAPAPDAPQADEFGLFDHSPTERFLIDDNVDQIKSIVRPGYAYFTNSVGGSGAGRVRNLGGVNVIGQGIAESGLLFNESNKGLRIRPFMYPLGAMEDAGGTSVAEQLKQAVSKGDFLRNAPLTFVYELPIGDVPFQRTVIDDTTIFDGRDDVILNAAKALGLPGTELATAAADSIKEKGGVSRGRGLNRVIFPNFIKGVFVQGQFMTLKDYKQSLGMMTVEDSVSAVETAVEVAQEEENTTSVEAVPEAETEVARDARATILGFDTIDDFEAARESEQQTIPGRLGVDQDRLAVIQDAEIADQATEVTEAPEVVEETEVIEEETGKKTKGGRLDADLLAMIELLGDSMYEGNTGETAVKELVQNSFDGIKSEQAIGSINASTIHVLLDKANRRITIIDDGIGMTVPIVEQAFFTIAGTSKEGLPKGQRSGGFGMAKIQFLFSSKTIELETIRDGQRVTVKTTPEAIKATVGGGSSFDIVTEPAEQKSDAEIKESVHNGRLEGRGTRVSVTLPEYQIDSDGEKHHVSFPRASMDFLGKPLLGDVEVRVTQTSTWGDPETKILKIGRHFDYEQMPKFTDIEFSWGRATLYLNPKRREGDHGSMEVLSSGLWQFRDYVRNVPYDMVLDIKPEVDAVHPHYPFKKERESFRSTIKSDIVALENYLKSYGAGQHAEEVAKRFGTAVSMERISMEDMGGDLESARKAILARFESEAKKGEKSLKKVTELEREDLRKRVEELRKRDRKVGIKIENKEIYTGDGLNITEEVNDAVKEEDRIQSKAKESFRAERDIVKQQEFMESKKVDPSKPLFHNNTDVDFIEDALNAIDEGKIDNPTSPQEFFSEIGSITVEFRERIAKVMYGYRGLSKKTRPYATGISIDKRYHGVHVRVPYTAFFINPLNHDAKTPLGAAQGMLHTLMHEAAHFITMEHDAVFANQQYKIATEMADGGDLRSFEIAIEKVLAKHWDTFLYMREKYARFDTKNIGKPLEDESASSSESSASISRAGLGAPSDVAGGGGQAGVGDVPSEGIESTSGAAGSGARTDTIISESNRVDQGIQKKK